MTATMSRTKPSRLCTSRPPSTSAQDGVGVHSYGWEFTDVVKARGFKLMFYPGAALEDEFLYHLAKAFPEGWLNMEQEP